jgi:hypothetical protein
MPKVKDVNKYLMDKEKRDAMIRRNTIESSIFEGIYNVTEEDLRKPIPELLNKPPQKNSK